MILGNWDILFQLNKLRSYTVIQEPEANVKFSHGLFPSLRAAELPPQICQLICRRKEGHF